MNTIKNTPKIGYFSTIKPILNQQELTENKGYF